jgi:Putative Ig domain
MTRNSEHTILFLLLFVLMIGTAGCSGGVAPSRNGSPHTSLAITTTSLPPGLDQATYEAALSPMGGTAPYAWTVTGGQLPPGVTLALSAGTLSGKPMRAGTFSFSAQVEDSSFPAQTVSRTFSISVSTMDPQLQIMTAVLPDGHLGLLYTVALQASTTKSAYVWSIASGNLPAGLTLTSSGQISGTPAKAGIWSFAVSVTDPSSPGQTVSKNLLITIVSSWVLLKVKSPSVRNGEVNSSYYASLVVEGGTSPYSWSVESGYLPPGLSLTHSGEISGIPVKTGISSFTVLATDSSSPAQTGSINLSIAIAGSPAQLQIATPSLPNGIVNSPYSSTLTAGSGTTPYTWSILSGSLPEGLALTPTGQISGTPKQSGASSFTAEVNDSSSPPRSAHQAYSVKIATADVGVPLTSCGTLANSGTIYVLQSDVSAPGTCFSIQADDITLNANGHIITYNTGDQHYARYGISGMSCWDPDLTNGKANGNPCGGTFTNLTVFGGTITEGSGAAADYAHCIRLGQNASIGPTIYNTTFNFHSNSAKGISIQFLSTAHGLGPIIYDNIFNSRVTQIVDRDEEDGVAIGISGCELTPSLTSHIYNNEITGGPQSGILDSCEGAEIDHNTVKQGNPMGKQLRGVCDPSLGCQYANDFGILAWQRNGRIHDNTIQPLEGRGIQLSGGGNGVSGKGTIVQNNIITAANELNNNAEYDGCTSSGAYGIQWDDGILNSRAENNNVSVTADICIASAMRLTDVPTIGQNNSVGNTYTAIRTPTSLGCPNPQAGNVSGCAFAASFDMSLGTSGFTSTNDEFTGDSGIFWFDWVGANNVTFVSPRFYKGTTRPSNPWYFAVSTNGGGPVTNFHIRDAIFGSGVNPTDSSIAAQGPNQRAVSFYIDWTYSLTLTNQLGEFVSGATVTAVDTLGNQICSVATDQSGIGTCVLPQYRIHNDKKANQVEARNPMTITINESGCVSQTFKETISQTTSQSIQLSCN